MSVYAVALITIHDRERYGRYEEGFLPIFERYGGEVLVADDEAQCVEGESAWTRTVVLRFPNEERLRAWYGSPEYQELVKHRFASSKANIVVAKGFEGLPSA